MGLYCDAEVQKIAISGNFYGNRRGWAEPRKECFNTSKCSVWTYITDPRGTQEWHAVAAMGYKNHWWSIPKYKGGRATARF